VFSENVVDVYADKYLDFRDIPQLPAQFEITRRTEKPHNGMEAVKIRHAARNSPEFFKKGVAVIIVEKFACHFGGFLKADALSATVIPTPL